MIASSVGETAKTEERPFPGRALASRSPTPSEYSNALVKLLVRSKSSRGQVGTTSPF